MVHAKPRSVVLPVASSREFNGFDEDVATGCNAEGGDGFKGFVAQHADATARISRVDL